MIPDVKHDDIIEEIQAFRREHAARFGFEIDAIFRDLKESERLSGRTYTRRSPRRLAEQTARAPSL
ncbi:MAG: hypothetical protein WBC44_22275 [Planctomycetaceae bacterium]